VPATVSSCYFAASVCLCYHIPYHTSVWCRVENATARGRDGSQSGCEEDRARISVQDPPSPADAGDVHVTVTSILRPHGPHVVAAFPLANEPLSTMISSSERDEAAMLLALLSTRGGVNDMIKSSAFAFAFPCRNRSRTGCPTPKEPVSMYSKLFLSLRAHEYRWRGSISPANCLRHCLQH